MTLNLIVTLKTSINKPKHTQNTKKYLFIFLLFKNVKIQMFQTKKNEWLAMNADLLWH